MIQEHHQVKLTKMKHIVEIQYLSKRNTRANIKKLNANEYLVYSSGEIKDFQTKSENRSQSMKSLSKSFKKLRNLIRNNFDGGPSELMLTLSYGENMTDTKQLYADIKNFIKKLKYHHGHFEYLIVIEPQGRGAWHAHMLVKFEQPITLDNNTTIWKYWGHGFTRTKRLKDVDDIGAYLTAYLADIPLEDVEKMKISEMVQVRGEEVEKTHADGKKKKYIKGGRLHMYPSGMNLFRKSKGIKYPDSELIRYDRAKKKHSLSEPTFQREYSCELEEFTQKIIYEQYNMKR